MLVVDIFTNIPRRKSKFILAVYSYSYYYSEARPPSSQLARDPP